MSFELPVKNLYEINKTLVEQNEKPLSQQQIKNKKKIIREVINKTNNSYYMLLCNERKDYTIFAINNPQKAVDILCDECLINRGQIKSIETKDNETSCEIWISIDGESFCYFFFPYDIGVIIT